MQFHKNVAHCLNSLPVKFDYKIRTGLKLGFVKAHHKIRRRRNGGCGPALGELPKVWGFPFNIYTMAEASNFKFSTQLGFAKAHHKITPIGKSGYGLGLVELFKILRFHFNIYTVAEASDFKFGTQLGFAKVHHKTTPRGKVGVAFC